MDRFGRLSRLAGHPETVFRDAAVGPEGAYYSEELGEFVLPYERVRTATDPHSTLPEFLQSSYEAAADSAGWPRSRLERASPP